jgi:very-short-patch-repair endonuclease
VIPVTTPARTLIDVASVASAEVVEEALDDALRRGIVSITRLRKSLETVGGGGRPGVASMRRLLDARTGPIVPQSVLETRLLRVVREAELPQPVLQHEIWARGHLVAIVDFAYPAERLAIEADGYRWHSGRQRWHRDRLRRNELTLLGWRVIHVTWDDLCNRPAAVVASIEHALARRI